MKSFRIPFRGFIYEMRHLLVSIPLLIIIALIVLASVGSLASVSQVTSPQGLYGTISGVYYFSQGHFQFEFYAYDEFLQPYSGVYVNVSFYLPGGAYLSSFSSETGLDGLANLSVSLPLDQYNVSISADDQRHDLQGYYDGQNSVQDGQSYPLQLFYGSVSSLRQSAVIPLFEVINAGLQSNNFNNEGTLLQAFYIGPNGSAPPSYRVYWAGPFNNTGQTLAPLPESAMHFLGTLTALHQTFSLSVPNATYEGFGDIPVNQILQVELFSSSGQFLAQDTNVSAGAFAPQSNGNIAPVAAFNFTEQLLEFFVPLMAMVAAYSAYGKDRVSGVLDSTLCGPISRESLTLSRYFAVVAALGFAVIMNTAVINVITHWSLGVYLPLYVSFALIGGMVVEVAVFTGLIFMASRYLRSTSSLMGLAIGLFALFDIVWLFLIHAIEINGYNHCTAAASCNAVTNLGTQLDFLNPAQFLNLVGTATSGANVPWVTPLTVTVAAIVWMAVPLIILTYHVRTRD